MADEDWIAESILQFTRSPLWRSPVENFVDDNCFIFTADEELTVEQTQVHMAFQKLIDNLLTTFVHDLGVELESALSAVRNSMDKKASINQSAEKLLQYIFYVDNFCTFHKMMRKRNIELDVLAARAYYQNKKGGEEGGNSTFVASNGDVDEETALKMAIEFSLRDESQIRRQMELEDVQIQEALDLSIRAEEERMRRAAQQLQKETAEQAKQLGVAAAEQAKAEKLTTLQEEKDNMIHQLEACALERRQESMLRYLSATQEVKSEAPTSAPVTKASESRAEPQPNQAPQQSNQQVPQPKVAVPAAVPALMSPPITTQPPHVPPSKTFGFKALPSIQPSFKQLQTFVVSNTAPEPQKQAQNVPDASTPTASPTKEEMEARARYMREQREKILLQNKAKREKELKEYNANDVAENPKTGDLHDGERQMTLDLARRLRDDILNEAKR